MHRSSHPVIETREPGAPWSYRDAARYLRVSSKTLERRAKTGELKTIRFGRLIRIPDSEIQRMASMSF